jgi:hypothetical protein
MSGMIISISMAILFATIYTIIIVNEKIDADYDDDDDNFLKPYK